jgi:hypothetical protein
VYVGQAHTTRAYRFLDFEGAWRAYAPLVTQ